MSFPDSARLVVGLFKLVLLLIGGLVLIWRAAEDLSIAANEKSPTAIRVEDWHDVYRGQHWLAVTGRLAPWMGAIRGAHDKINSNEGNGYAYVPIIPADYAAGESVHAVAVIGPLPLSEIPDEIRRRAAGEATITGEIAPLGGYDGARLMPGVPLDPRVVYINENTAPSGGATGAFLLAVGIVLTLIAFWSIYRRLTRGVRERRRLALMAVAAQIRDMEPDTGGASRVA